MVLDRVYPISLYSLLNSNNSPTFVLFYLFFFFVMSSIIMINIASTKDELFFSICSCSIICSSIVTLRPSISYSIIWLDLDSIYW